MKISRSAISELEGGKRRSVSLAEFLILAAALEVPPAQLLYPTYPDGIVEFIPGHDTHSRQATNWISGDQTLHLPDEDNEHCSLSGYPNEVVRLTRLRDKLDEIMLNEITKGKDPVRVIELVDKKREEFNERIEAAGGTVEHGQG